MPECCWSPTLQVRDRTQDTLVAVGERLLVFQGEMEDMAGHVAMLYDVLAPDPAPREVLLTIVTETSNCELQAHQTVRHGAGVAADCSGGHLRLQKTEGDRMKQMMLQ